MIDVENIGRVRLLRLNRPEAKNAFNEAQYDSLTELLLEAEGDSTVAVVVITVHQVIFVRNVRKRMNTNGRNFVISLHRMLIQSLNIQ